MTSNDIRVRKVFAVVAGESVLSDPHQTLIGGGREGYGDPLPFIQDVVTDGYVEPGYGDPETAVVTGDWNYDLEKRIVARFVDKDADEGEMLTVGEALTKLGCECEWSDEWATCSDCGRLVRTQPDSYGWTRSYWDSPAGYTHCHECVKEDPEEYLEWLAGNDRAADTLDIGLKEHGFVKFQGDFENGLHEGQASDPKLVGKALRAKGISRYVFVIDGCGQFDLRFSVWVDKAQLLESGLDGCLLERSETDAPVSPAEQCKAMLKDSARAVAQLPPGEGVVVVQPDPTDPAKAVAKRVSPQDFIDGKALDS